MEFQRTLAPSADHHRSDLSVTARVMGRTVDVPPEYIRVTPVPATLNTRNKYEITCILGSRHPLTTSADFSGA